MSDGAGNTVSTFSGDVLARNFLSHSILVHVIALSFFFFNYMYNIDVIAKWRKMFAFTTTVFLFGLFVITGLQV